MRRVHALLSAASLCAASMLFVPTPAAASPEEAFENPPAAARPWVFWYWVNAAVSAEGITADLEALRDVGIGGVWLATIHDATDPPVFDPPAPQLSARFWDMIRHAFAEADRLGIQIAMGPCDGFATVGGVWVPPELSMQKVVWVEKLIVGGNRFEGQLDRPQAYEDYYEDIAVLAYPSLPGEGESSMTTLPKATTSFDDVDAADLLQLQGRVTKSGEGWFQYEFDEPFTARSITMHVAGMNWTTYQANRLIVEAGDDGEEFRRVTQLQPPRQGWQAGVTGVTHLIPETTAHFFRFVSTAEGIEPGAEDLDAAKWGDRLSVDAIELSGAPRIPHFQGKSAQAWRKAPSVTSEQLPTRFCVGLDSIIDLTDRMQPDGTLAWDAPEGNWTILRLGHTSTGQENESAGAAQGLEADKFNTEAVRFVYDKWFLKAARQAGPELAQSVLTALLFDSWEAGSQNWSPVFREEFERRRGYDMTRYLPAFAGVPVASAEVSERFLYDVRLTVNDLIIDNLYKPLAQWLHEDGRSFYGETTAPTMPTDGMQHYGMLDMPMGEFWLRSIYNDKPNDVHDAVSGAHIYGKPVVGAESFTEREMRWNSPPGDIKWLGDRNMALGINKFFIHLTTQNPWLDRLPGMSLDAIGLFFQRGQTWWPMAGAWVDYIARSSALLQLGRNVADVAYYTGEELPRRAILPELRVPPLPAGYAADSINRDVLMRLATVENGRLITPGGSYALLILPPSEEMTPEMAARIEELVNDGLTIYGPLPMRSPSLVGYPECDDSVREIAGRLRASDRIIHGKPLSEVLAGIGVQPDIVASPTDDTPIPVIEWIHRLADNRDIYFITNPIAQPQTIELSIRADNRIAEVWDPVTREQWESLTFTKSEGRITLSLRLPKHGSLFVVLRENSTGRQRRQNWVTPGPALELNGPWQVTFDSDLRGPADPQTFAELTDWSDSGDNAIRHYSGIAAYTTTFNWNPPPSPDRVWIDLGRVEDLARVTLNGDDLGIAWTAPMRLDATAALNTGRNELKIEVANAWANRMLGDQRLGDERPTWAMALNRSRVRNLQPSGLLGPVRLVTE